MEKELKPLGTEAHDFVNSLLMFLNSETEKIGNGNAADDRPSRDICYDIGANEMIGKVVQFIVDKLEEPE